MLQQQRLLYLPLVGMILVGLLVGVYLFAGKRFSKKTPSADIVKHTVKTPAEDVLKYWTADKMRSAKPAPMPHLDAPEKRKRPPRRPPGFPRPKQA